MHTKTGTSGDKTPNGREESSGASPKRHFAPIVSMTRTDSAPLTIPKPKGRIKDVRRKSPPDGYTGASLLDRPGRALR